MSTEFVWDPDKKKWRVRKISKIVVKRRLRSEMEDDLISAIQFIDAFAKWRPIPDPEKCFPLVTAALNWLEDFQKKVGRNG